MSDPEEFGVGEKVKCQNVKLFLYDLKHESLGSYRCRSSSLTTRTSKREPKPVKSHAGRNCAVSREHTNMFLAMSPQGFVHPCDHSSVFIVEEGRES